MRGRKPRPLTLQPGHSTVLREIARSRIRPAFQVRRAMILVAVAAGERVGAVAERAGCDAATVWRVCRRYEEGGLGSVLSLAPRNARN